MREEVLTERLTRLDVSTLPAGAYLLEVLSATQQRQVKKFLKQGF
ncbi:MAG: T9SS type A sorting domain-containing protein [Saprospiraceae bacterium]